MVETALSIELLSPISFKTLSFRDDAKLDRTTAAAMAHRVLGGAGHTIYLFAS
jgi:hypothetical protein